MNEVSAPAADQQRDQWTETLHRFCEEIAGWAKSRGWQVTWKEVDLREDLLGPYRAPMLVIQTERGAVMVEPVARAVMGASGRIDLYAYPSLYRVMLLRSMKDCEWRIRTDSGIFLKQPWSEQTFGELVSDLTTASDELSAH